MKRNKAWGRLNNKGAAMIAVLCIMAVFLTLCLAMLLTSSVLMNKAQKRLNEEQCKVSAVTMSKELEYDLCDDSTGAFRDFIANNISLTNWIKWPYYNPEESGHSEQSENVMLILEGSSPDAGVDLSKTTGNVSMKLYWEFRMGGDISDVLLHVDVTAAKGDARYTVKSVYGAMEVSGGKWEWSLYERS